METTPTSLAASSISSGMVLPRYHSLLLSCRELVVGRFSMLFDDMLADANEIVLELSDQARTNQERSHYFEILHELLLSQTELRQTFVSELARGFDNFREGHAEPLRTPVSQLENTLSLIDQDDYEVSLAYGEVARRANQRYGEYLLALNHRLAVLAGGVALGEYNPALPGAPAQVADAMHTTLEKLPIAICIRFHSAWALEFERQVISRAGDIYAQFNSLLIGAGVLPNLSLDAIGFQSGRSGATGLIGKRPSPTDKAANDGPHHDLFDAIREMLASRHPRPSGNDGTVTDFTALIQSLNSLQFATTPLDQTRFDELSLQAVKAHFAERSAAMHHLLRQQPMAAADADLIELVGMLFEFILNDTSLPDSVKALLCYLHTPILKVAMLDREFFSHTGHPARQLLDTLTQAGAQCGGGGDEAQGVFAKLRQVVDRILHEFKDDPQVFATVLDDFSHFMDNLEQRSKSMEKRSVESAKGRERLREARQAVSKELVDLTWNRRLTKPVESLLLGSWANLLVLTYLRHGKDSPAWHEGLKMARDIVWSIQPKTRPAERHRLRELWPEMQEKILTGLALIGEAESHAKAFFAELETLHGTIHNLGGLEVAEPADTHLEVHPAPPDIQAHQAVWEDIDAPLVAEELGDAADMLAALELLKGVKLGTWFEFGLRDQPTKIRAKLSWFSETTRYYIFVDQVGIQVAVKSLRALCQEIAQGETRIVPMTKKPFMDRALQAMHALLRPGENLPEVPDAESFGTSKETTP